MTAAAIAVLTQATIACSPPPPSQAADAPKHPLVHVIELHGEVGDSDDETTPSILACDLVKALEQSQKAGATAIVLDIDGPGGDVFEKWEMIEAILAAQKERGSRLVALPRSALSAWAGVVLACKEIVVTPMARVGAAVTITKDAKGNWVEATPATDAVSQKRKSPEESLRRMVESFTGRPPCIWNSMNIQKAELWWHSSHGFTDTQGAGTGWERLDDSIKVCCLNADEMLRTHLAIGEVKIESLSQELPAALGLPTDTKVAIVKPPQTLTPTAKKARRAALNEAARKCRDARGLMRKINFTRSTKVVSKWDDWDSDLNTPKTAKEIQVAETDSQLNNRVASKISEVLRKVPTPESIKGQPAYSKFVGEARSMLTDAVKSARQGIFPSAIEQLEAADELLQMLANP